jgi:hypothetical protein
MKSKLEKNCDLKGNIGISHKIFNSLIIKSFERLSMENDNKLISYNIFIESLSYVNNFEIHLLEEVYLIFIPVIIFVFREN